ncbi:MAG: glycoside hydrolase family 2 TIM barrel-domain containing protein [Candidatus Omnitrophota bacterium]|nr:glycoside hydrolase family 2 TIM barrel-domain containing protein [Candidatus Omnitrophota bacterium]MDZ4241481.1 glycoside hydrolase family 2 TIM barrel-domain containing protein [Candidatus Omnitrophota bacterium]
MRLFLILCFLASFTANAHAATVKVEKTGKGWQLLVDGAPFLVKGICYTSNEVGKSAHDNTLRDWMEIDDDNDGRNDLAYQSWVDKNLNSARDEDEPEVGDFQLLKDMGANTLRIYHHPSDNPELLALNPAATTLLGHAPNKKLLREMHEKYGIWVMMGDLIGAYAVGSGAEWKNGTDYRDPVQRTNMMKSVENMVLEFKDEPYILIWAIGNENNLTHYTQNNSAKYPEDYAKFVNEVARRIHELDPNHPVCLVNGETMMADVYAKFSPDVDIFGMNSYRNWQGFNTLWKEVDAKYDKPVLITEYGTGYPPVNKTKLAMREDRQARMHEEGWLDIEAHAAGGPKQPNNAIGGLAFEWTDNWWQSGQPLTQDLAANDWHFEWNGIAGQGDGTQSPRIRQLRKVYFMYKERWNTSSDQEGDRAAIDQKTDKD